MNDEAFHLTPVDARRYDFGSALRGYDKTRVDQFRDQVADELERLSRVNQELEAKAKGLREEVTNRSRLLSAMSGSLNRGNCRAS